MGSRFFKFVRNVATYSTLFFAGYYVGGGFEEGAQGKKLIKQEDLHTRLNAYESRIVNLEKKVLGGDNERR